MTQQAKWFGVSLVMHLAVATVFIFMVSSNAERTPKAIMVVLDNLVLPELPQHKKAKTPPVVATRPVASAALKELESTKPVITKQVPQPLTPQFQPANPTTERRQARDLPTVSPENPVTAHRQQKSEVVDVAPATPVMRNVQLSSSAEMVRPAPEKAQQRYLKEHFTYIRDLITKRLIYPSMARRMHWSGKVVVAFVITEDGSVHNTRVVETSGFSILDNSALETVRNAAPFPKPPVRAEIVIPISFKMM